MIKFISKHIAKNYINRHREDNKITGITNATIKGVELYKDASIYVVLYIILSIIFVMGVPFTIFILTNFWWGLLTVFVASIINIIVSFKLVMGVLRGVKDEVATLINTLQDNEKTLY